VSSSSRTVPARTSMTRLSTAVPKRLGLNS
jgi:hypothetical protein